MRAGILGVVLPGVKRQEREACWAVVTYVDGQERYYFGLIHWVSSYSVWYIMSPQACTKQRCASLRITRHSEILLLPLPTTKTDYMTQRLLIFSPISFLVYSLLFLPLLLSLSVLIPCSSYFFSVFDFILLLSPKLYFSLVVRNFYCFPVCFSISSHSCYHKRDQILLYTCCKLMSYSYIEEYTSENLNGLQTFPVI